MSIARLLDAGFVPVGSWSLDGSLLKCSLLREAKTYNVLYAFADPEEVLYVGKTTIALRDRMYQYQRPGLSQRTNIRVNDLLRTFLAADKPISILALPDPGNLEYHGFHLNLAAGIEDSVIGQVQPKWNKAAK